MSETAPSPLLLLSTSYLPSSTTSLPSQLEKQQQAQYLRAPPPPSLRVPSPTPSSIGSVAVSATTAAVTATTTTTATAAGPQSVRHIGTALWNDASARRMRVNVLNELSTGWVHLSISSRVLILYYTLATLIEITVTTTILVMERAHLRTCMYLVVFLVLYLVRAVTINFFLLRKFLWTRPDNLPVNFSGAVGAHYRTMINWASLVLVLFSIAVLVTQSECSRVSPPLFYLVLTFSLLGYMCASALLLIWIGILFCMHGFMVLLELFHVGPTAMRWQGAQDDLISKVPLVRFKKGETAPPPPPPSPPPPLPPMMTGGVAAAATETEKKEKDIALATGVATKTLPSSTSSSSSPSSPTSSRLESHGPASTFTVTITSPDSEDSSSSSSRRHSTEIGRSSPPLDTIQESKQELVEETGATALSSSALATHEAVAAASVAMDQQEQQQEQRQEPQQQQQKRKSEIVIKIPSVPASSAEAETDTDAGEARPHFGFFAEGYQPDTPSPTTTTTVIQLPEAPPPPCATAQQQQRPLEPMATMTIEEGQGIFVDGELVQEGGPEMISNRCSICLCEYEDAEELRHMPCNHFFHRECLDEWLKLKRTCPLCKYDIQDLNRFSKRLSWKRNSHQHHHQHRRRSSAAASTTTNNSSRNGRASLNLWRRSQS
ncbi:hypothetical protein DFQ26_008706 [Actinomortierella ambigua]|nr:hypothetical protein DFQ26_008706 [Actinomortierella ambigua]